MFIGNCGCRMAGFRVAVREQRAGARILVGHLSQAPNAGSFKSSAPLLLIQSPSRFKSPTSRRGREKWGTPTHRKREFTFRDGRGPLPSCARFPSDGLCRSTNRDTNPNNAGVLRSDRGGVHRPRGCDRLCHGSLCPVWPRLFRWHAGTLHDHRRAPAALQTRTTKALPRLVWL
jgi:hypothetical protein